MDKEKLSLLYEAFRLVNEAFKQEPMGSPDYMTIDSARQVIRGIIVNNLPDKVFQDMFKETMGGYDGSESTS